jgi:hypothetical protein
MANGINLQDPLFNIKLTQYVSSISIYFRGLSEDNQVIVQYPIAEISEIGISTGTIMNSIETKDGENMIFFEVMKYIHDERIIQFSAAADIHSELFVSGVHYSTEKYGLTDEVNEKYDGFLTYKSWSQATIYHRYPDQLLHVLSNVGGFFALFNVAVFI